MKTPCWQLLCAVLVIPSLLVLPSPARGENWEAVDLYGGWPNDLSGHGAGALVVAASNGGIYHSPDAGESWQQIYHGPQFEPRAVASNDAGDILVGSDGFSGIRFMRSSDAGESWQVVGSGLPFGGVHDLHVTPNQNLFACTQGSGLYVSNTNGTTFTRVSSMPASYPTVITSNASGNLFVGTQFSAVNFYASFDGGATWVQRDAGIAVDVADVAVDPVDGTTLYVAGGSKIYKSTDNGLTWTDLGAPPVFSYTSVAATGNGNIFAANYAGIYDGGKVFRTGDGGASWTEEPGLPGHSVGRFLFADDKLYLGVHGPGVYKLENDGSGWERKVNGMRNVRITSLIGDPFTGTLYAVLQDQGIHVSNDDGITWEPLDGGMPRYEHIYSMVVAQGPSGPRLYASGAYEGIYTATNGSDWTPVFAVSATALGVNEQGNVFAGYGNFVYRTIHPEGAAWSQVATLPGAGNISDIACAGNKVYVASTNGGVFESQDNGATWAAINNGLTDLHTTGIAVDPDPEADCRITLGTTSGVFDFNPATSNWQLNSSFGPGGATRIRKFPDLGVALREDQVKVYDAADPCEYEGMEIVALYYKDLLSRLSSGGDGDPQFVRILATYGYGLWRSAPALPTHVALELPSTARVSLNAASNPFARSTTLQFELAHPGHVELKVFDATGRLVATLLEEWRSAGGHTVSWDASRQTSGVYFSRLSAGGEVQTRRLVLLR